MLHSEYIMNIGQDFTDMQYETSTSPSGYEANKDYYLIAF